MEELFFGNTYFSFLNVKGTEGNKFRSLELKVSLWKETSGLVHVFKEYSRHKCNIELHYGTIMVSVLFSLPYLINFYYGICCHEHQAKVFREFPITDSKAFLFNRVQWG